MAKFLSTATGCGAEKVTLDTGVGTLALTEGHDDDIAPICASDRIAIAVATCEAS